MAMTGIDDYVIVDGLVFDKENPPNIESRADAILLLARLIEAEWVENDSVALKAIRGALERGVI
jgi:hypothetical protein